MISTNIFPLYIIRFLDLLKYFYVKTRRGDVVLKIEPEINSLTLGYYGFVKPSKFQPILTVLPIYTTTASITRT